MRLLDNSFARQVAAAEAAGESPEALQALLGRGRAKKGMFEGDMEAGELEIGQVSGQIRQLVPAAEIVQELVREYELLTQGMADQRFHWK